jgi:hypothetical protein
MDHYNLIYIYNLNFILSNNSIFELDNIFNIIEKNDILCDESKTLIKYWWNSTCYIDNILVKFEKLMCNVISFIENHKKKNDIYKILNETLIKHNDSCNYILIVYIINNISNFWKNDLLKNNDSEKIGDIIMSIRSKLLSENNYTRELHKDMTIKELMEKIIL